QLPDVRSGNSIRHPQFPETHPLLHRKPTAAHPPDVRRTWKSVLPSAVRRTSKSVSQSRRTDILVRQHPQKVGQSSLRRTTKVDSKLFPWILKSPEAAKTRRFSGFLTDLEVRPTFCRRTDIHVRPPPRRLRCPGGVSGIPGDLTRIWRRS
ncbi:MAG: hypothetical protein RLZZ458_721, partial [Planctomycetota bacterium]